MKKISTLLNSPKRILFFTICVILISVILASAFIRSSSSAADKGVIGPEKGALIALDNAGYNLQQVSDLSTAYGNKDFDTVYKIRFTADGYRFYYVIESTSGEILKYEKNPVSSSDASDIEDDSGQFSSQEGASQEQNTSSQSAYIDIEAAKSIALADSGVSSASAVFTKAKLDREDGIYVYEIEFYVGNYEYEYEINAVDGKIMDKSIEED